MTCHNCGSINLNSTDPNLTWAKCDDCDTMNYACFCCGEVGMVERIEKCSDCLVKPYKVSHKMTMLSRTTRYTNKCDMCDGICGHQEVKKGFNILCRICAHWNKKNKEYDEKYASVGDDDDLFASLVADMKASQEK